MISNLLQRKISKQNHACPVLHDHLFNMFKLESPNFSPPNLDVVVLVFVFSFIPPDPERGEKTSTLKSWDVFRVLNRSKQRGVDDEFYNKLQKGLKIVLSMFLTFAILALTMLSKSALFLITSNVYSNVTFECTWTSYKEVVNCTRVPADRVRTDAFHPSPSVQARWIWALFIVVCTPCVFTFGKCLWRVCFKKTRNPTPRVLFLVSLYVIKNVLMYVKRRRKKSDGTKNGIRQIKSLRLQN